MTTHSDFKATTKDQQDFESVIEEASGASTALSHSIGGLKTAVDDFVQRHSKEKNKNE